MPGWHGGLQEAAMARLFIDVTSTATVGAATSASLPNRAMN
jgi:hypothetical protein